MPQKYQMEVSVSGDEVHHHAGGLDRRRGVVAAMAGMGHAYLDHDVLGG